MRKKEWRKKAEKNREEMSGGKGQAEESGEER